MKQRTQYKICKRIVTKICKVSGKKSNRNPGNKKSGGKEVRESNGQ
jgi:hypothetical protein